MGIRGAILMLAYPLLQWWEEFNILIQKELNMGVWEQVHIGWTIVGCLICTCSQEHQTKECFLSFIYYYYCSCYYWHLKEVDWLGGVGFGWHAIAWIEVSDGAQAISMDLWPGQCNPIGLKPIRNISRFQGIDFIIPGPLFSRLFFTWYIFWSYFVWKSGIRAILFFQSWSI